MNKLKGIVKLVSDKTKGILLLLPDGSEAWWNPIGDSAKQVTPALKGSEVEVTIVNQEKRSFSYLEIVKPEEIHQGSVGLDRDHIIVRQNALAHASIFIKIMAENCNVTGVKFLEDELFRVAAKCEEWVWRK
jgi:hypothetical protein